MNSIDKRAIIAEGAVVGKDTVIEPNVVIGPEVKVGNNVHIMANAYITGDTYIGDNTIIFPSAVIGTVTQAKKYSGGRSGVIIGSSNIIREFVTINSTEGGKEEYTTIGDNNLIMTYSHIAHHCKIGNRVVMSNAATLAGHVHVYDYATIGGLAGIHQFVRIGSHTMIGGKSKVTQDIPPFLTVNGNPSKVAGINSIGLKRKGFSNEQIKNIKDVHRIFYRKGLNISQALRKIEDTDNQEAKVFSDFVRSSERGILFKKY